MACLALAGTYQLNTSVASTSGTFYGTGPLPAGPATLTVMSGLTGYLAAGQYVTDGGASLTAQPLLITGGSGSTWTVAGNYYPSIVNDTTMVGSLSSVIPGEYIQNSAITTPVKVLSYQGACGISGAINGGLGCYTLSASPNSAGTVGSSGSPATLAGTTISDGGAIAPGAGSDHQGSRAGNHVPSGISDHMLGAWVMHRNRIALSDWDV